MTGFDTRQLSGLEWHQQSTFGQTYQLKSGDSVIAELAFPKVLGTLAEARTASSAWSFKRRGAFTAVIGARRLGEEREIATYRPNWSSSKGLLKLENGEEFHLKPANFRASEWVLSTVDGQELLRYHNQGFLKHGARLEMTERAKQHPQLQLMVVLTWYILVMYRMDSSAAAAAVPAV
ncbi:MAG: hypothetical protein C0504_15835 [Candidatus Solibacter sp.]|nr:hypothetical protein [Candidatus Solibacter sp.]